MATAQKLTDPDAPPAPVAQGTLQGPDGAPLPLESTAVEAVVTGPLADVTVRQKFRNDRAVAIEAVYLFPLPEEASVHTMRFRIEDRVVEGVVKEKAEARRDYEAALAQGRAATLLEEDRPMLFTLSVANIAPGATIEVELGYQDLLPYDDGRWRFLFPMVAPPQYREPPSAALPGGLPPPRTRVEDRSADVTVSVRFPRETPVHELRSVSHLVAIEDHPTDGTLVRLRADGPLANRDFTLDWRAAEEGVRPWLYLERKPSEDGTFLLVITPSAPSPTTERGGGAGDLKTVRCGNCGGAVRDLRAIRDIPGLGPVFPCEYCGAVLTPATDVITRPVRPRDVLILVDRSASMRGAEARVQSAVQALLRGLGPGDAVQLQAFDHERVSFDDDPTRFVVLSPELAGHAAQFLTKHPPRGGSELEDALGVSAKMPAREGRTRVVVLVSDVAVGNEGRLLRRVPELLGAGAKLFVLAVGEGVDRRLASRLARAGSGVCEVVPHGPLAEEVIARFARRVREAGPVLTDLQLWWEQAETRELLPTPVPPLYGGEALRVLGRFKGTGAAKLVITGLTVESKPFRQELDVSLPAESAQAPGLERAWARRKIEALAESSDREPTNKAHAQEGLRLALAFSLVGRWTSLVAEDKKVSVGKRRARKGLLVNFETGEKLVLDGTPKVIGRARTADLCIPKGGVSRRHAEVTFDGTNFILRDLGTTNGTLVNGRTIREMALYEFAKVQIYEAQLVFTFAQGDGPDAWFEYVPTQRAVDAASGTEGQRGAAVTPPQAERKRVITGAMAIAAPLAEYAAEDDAEDDAEVDGAVPLRMPTGASSGGVLGAMPPPWNAPPVGGGPPPVGAPSPFGPSPMPSVGVAPMLGRAPPAVGGSPSTGALPPLGGPPPMAGPPPATSPLGPMPGPPPPSFGAPRGPGAPPPAPGGRAPAPAPVVMPPPAAMPMFQSMGPASTMAARPGAMPGAAPPPAAPPAGAFGPSPAPGLGLGPLPPLPSRPPGVPAMPPRMPAPVAPPPGMPGAPPPAPMRPMAPPEPVRDSFPEPPRLASVSPPISLPPLASLSGPPLTPPPAPLPPSPAPGRASAGETQPCSRCFHHNPVHLRFCLACGSDLRPPSAPFAPPPAPPAARRASAFPLRSPASEPYPEHELQWLRGRMRGELDLVFLVDATGSMGSYIAEVRERLLELIDAVRASPLCQSLRIGVVAYRDHPPQERSFVTQTTALTDDLDRVRAAVERLSASGGGDGPEAVTDGLFDVVRLDWRPAAARAVVWFGDAPPHGVEASGDSFASGCPCGHHWYAQAESCREMGVAVYAIGCLPTLRSYQGAESVYRTVARTTRGMFLPLREASLLVPLIGGAAECALDGQRIDAFLEALLAHHADALAPADMTERVRWITEAFRKEKIRARAMDFDVETATQLPLRFRDVGPTDIRASLERLRGAGYDLDTLRRAAVPRG